MNCMKDARRQMAAELKAAGFLEVTMLSRACEPSEQDASGPRVVAA